MSFKGSDETYLEAFVENCLPTYQIKRNMELIQSLDRSCVADLNRLHGLEDAYLVHAETAVLQLDVILPQDSTTPATVRPLGKGSDRDETDDHPGQTLIPTTDELIEYTYQPDIMTEIEHLQQECLQKADEKVSVAEQSLRWIDSIVQRLDDDIEAMEELIGHQEAAQPNELAACQVTPGSEWILAKVLEHDVKNGFYRLADEDVDSQKGTWLWQRTTQRVAPGNSVVLFMSTLLNSLIVIVYSIVPFRFVRHQ